jgi:toxin ParE1/3/4
MESGSVETADRLIDSLSHRFWLLALRPHMGRRRDDLRSGLRSFPVGDYVILYRQETKAVFIFRVIHGSRDLPAIIRQSH